VDSDESSLLVASFINAVTRKYQRYSPVLLSKDSSHVSMTVDYEYLFSVELLVEAESYTITASCIAKEYDDSTAQKLSAKVAAEVLKATESFMVRGTQIRDRRDRDGNR
jgi:hypothetical protein